MDLTGLGATVQMLFKHALAPTTQKSYSSAQQRFLLFCKKFAVAPLPLTEHLLCHYVAFLYEEGLAHSSMKGYLSALRQLQISFNLPDPNLAAMPRLNQVLRGAKVLRGKQGRNCGNRKLPITPVMLRQIRKLWQSHQHDLLHIMLWAVCCVCFFGFFRSGELTAASSSADPLEGLQFQDIAVDKKCSPSLVQFTLRASKTDPFRQGVKVVVGRTGDDLCPISALLAFLAVRGEASGPLFQHRDGRPLARRTFVEKIKSALAALGYPAEKYAGHSFRAGAATTAATAGFPDSLIKVLGRWESAAYQLYIRLPSEELKGVSAALAKGRAYPAGLGSLLSRKGRI